MEHTRTANALLAAAFLALIVSEPVAQFTHDFRAGIRPAPLEIFGRTPSSANLRAFEDTLREQSVIANTIRPALQYWRFAVMSDAGSNGMVGNGDWLYYKPGVRFLVEPWTEDDNADAYAAIESFRDQLARQNTELLVLVVPGKESVHPGLLTARARDRVVNDHVLRFVDGLKARGIHIMYLVPPHTGAAPLYLKQDSHWTPQYAASCAKQVAEHIIGQGWVSLGSTAYGVTDIAVKRHGDILRMAKSRYVLDAFPPEQIVCEQVLNPETGMSYQDDATSPILVLGDSFLRIFERDEPGSAGFVSHLARALNQPVTSLINDGGASTLVREELRRKPELLRGKRLVIWEFVDRDLRFGIDGWRDVQLPIAANTSETSGHVLP